MSPSRLFKLLVVLAAFSAGSAGSAVAAAPGDLDATFGTDGKIVLQDPNHSAVVRLISVGGGRTVLALNRPNSTTSADPRLSRARLVGLDARGAVDPSFGTGGLVLYSEGAGLSDAATLNDGSFIVLDSSNSLRRYDTGGNLMPTFGAGGFVDVDAVITEKCNVSAVIQQHSGRIVAAGGSDDTFVSGGSTIPAPEPCAVGLNLDGSLDVTFAQAGLMTFSESRAASPRAGLAIDEFDRIFVGTSRAKNPAPDPINRASWGLLRLKSDGTLDPAFGSGGFVYKASPYEVLGGVTAISPTRSGNILVSVAEGYVQCKYGCGFQRYSYKLDAAGKNLGYWGRHFYASSFANRSDGQVATGAGTYSSVFAQLAKEDGSANLSFGEDGLAGTSVGMEPTNALDGGGGPTEVAFDSVGNVLVAAGFRSSGSASQRKIAIVRFLGLNGGVGAAHPVIRKGTSGLYFTRRHKVRRPYGEVSGTAGPRADVASVSVAIRRISKKQLNKGRCTWLAGKSGRFKTVSAVKKTCDARVFVRAAGKSKWKLKLGRPLSPGNYAVWVRARLKSGQMNSLTKEADWYSEVKVLPNTTR